MSEKPEPKFRVGQTVYFTNWKEEHECVIEEVVTGYQGAGVFLPFDKPVYWILWGRGLRNCVREDELSAEATSGSRPAA